MVQATQETRFAVHAQVVNHIARFLSDVDVRFYIDAKIEKVGTENAVSEIRLADEESDRRWHDVLMGRVQMTEAERELPAPNKPPLDYGTLEVTLVDNPFWSQSPDTYARPIVALSLQDPRFDDFFQDCAIWWGLGDTRELDAAVRRLLKRVEDFCEETQ